jgi:hypothetical protein
MKIGTRGQIALLFYSSFCVIVFTAAVYAAAMFPPLTAHAGLWIAGLTLAGMAVGVPLAWAVGRAWPREWHEGLIARQSPLAHEPGRDI